MITADQAAKLLQPDLAQRVAQMKRDGVPKMDAYGLIGGALGKSGVWVRRVIGRDQRAAVGLHDALNFHAWAHGLSAAAAYRRLCERIGASADRIEAENNELRRELDAALGSDRPAPARAHRAAEPQGPPARRPRRASPSALVAPAARADRVGAPSGGDLNDLPLWRAIERE